MSGIIADRSAVQFRMLNRSKGPAVWSPRTQNDRMLFTRYWREALEQIPNLDLMGDMVTGLVIENEEVKGVKTRLGLEIYAPSVILTAHSTASIPVDLRPPWVKISHFGGLLDTCFASMAITIH